MRKYAYRLLPLYLDTIFIWAVIGVIDYLFRGGIGAIVGPENSYIVGGTASLGIAAFLPTLKLSPGERLLGYAKWEDAQGVKLRQWPNLLLGTLVFLSGLKEIVRWTEPGVGMPAYFLVEETPFKVVLLTALGALYVLAGAMLLAFLRGAKTLNFGLMLLGTVGATINLTFSREAVIAATMARQSNQGLPASREYAEGVLAMAPYATAAFLTAMAVILWFCRERSEADETAFRQSGPSASE